MRRFQLFTAAIAFCGAVLLPANAQEVDQQPAAVAAKPAQSILPIDGAELARSIRICQEAGVTTKDIANWRACSGYLAGIIVGSTATSNASGAKPLFCMPADAKDRDIQDTVVAHIENDPRVAAQPAHIAVLDAMAIAFPCE